MSAGTGDPPRRSENGLRRLRYMWPRFSGSQHFRPALGGYRRTVATASDVLWARSVPMHHDPTVAHMRMHSDL
jgi:hypothetical protein